MTELKDLGFEENQSEALLELRNALIDEFAAEVLMVYGSYARGEPSEESDIDLLIVLPEPFSRQKRHEITELVFETNLKYDTNISSLVVDRENWDAGMFSVLPIRQEILAHGVSL